MRGRHAFDRCRRCYGSRLTSGMDSPAWHFSPTGRTRLRTRVGRRHNVLQAEVRCSKGHVWWSSHPATVAAATGRQ